VNRLDEIIGNALSRTGVPGLAAAVVHEGKLLYAKGFGVRDIDQPGAVDPATVFHLAPLSKPLSSTVVAGVVGHGVVQWTDLFSHQSGLPDHAGDLLEDLGYDQPYILNRLRLEPLAPFRANYAYTNFGLTAAAEAAAAAADSRGRTWPTASCSVQPGRRHRSPGRRGEFQRARPGEVADPAASRRCVER
jgi:CubicO group peptidase (beta-lactamase class C family)